METTKFLLDEKALPESWYNVVPDLPFQLDPPLHPGTREPVGPEAFAPLFPEEIIKQEVTAELWMGPGPHFIHYFVRDRRLL